MEAVNGQTVRQREKVIRGIKKEDSPIFKGTQIYHIFIRPHLALEGKTPSEMAGIRVMGEDRWITLIQNAKNQISTNWNIAISPERAIRRYNTSLKSKPVTIPHEKGFDPSLFDCMDKALTATLGKTTITTFYFAIQERYQISESEIPQKPNQVILGLKEILGEVGFRVLERPMMSQIKQTFEIMENVHDLQMAIDLAKRNYLKASIWTS